MAKSAPNPEVDWYFEKDGPWAAAFAKLRAIALASGLAEELKWGHPCYGLDGKNVVLMHGFKDYCALLFHKGALMDDDQGILVQQTENVQSARQVRFGEAGSRQQTIDFPGALEPGQGRALASDWLRRSWARRERVAFAEAAAVYVRYGAVYLAQANGAR